MNFKGYLRKDGLVGIRNYVAVISVVGCVNEPARKIAEGIESARPFLHHQGCCQLSPDLETITRTLSGIGMNPNVGAVLLVSLGCESISAEKIQEIINLHKPTALIRLQELGGITNTVKEGIKKVKILLNKIRQDRENFNINRLTIGIKCGASDATSGLASNPAVGQAVNILIEKGATVIFGETTEVMGAEQVLSKRAENKEVGKKIIEKVRMIEKRANMCGVDMRGGQPTAGNIRGGITTIEEKSLGAIVKSGNYKIKDVLEYGEKPAGPGLYFMDSPGREMEFLTGVVSGGSQIIIFSTGVGAPQGFPIVPVLKITGNSHTFLKMKEHMDIDVSNIIKGNETIEEAGYKIFTELIKVASGKRTKSEKTKYDICGINSNIYTTGPVI